MKKIAILASGSGSNAENIITYLRNKNVDFSSTIYTNNPNAFVIKRAEKLQEKCVVFSKNEMLDGTLQNMLCEEKFDLIILAGFLLKIPAEIIEVFPQKIINIHPALLPKYGGKGMYGDNVHRAVCAAKEKESGITIHYVNENYDEGTTIFQAKCEVLPTDSPEDVAQKVHFLEYEHFPKVIESLL